MPAHAPARSRRPPRPRTARARSERGPRPRSRGRPRRLASTISRSSCSASAAVSPGIVRRSACSTQRAGIARELLPALDERRVDAAAAELRVRRIRAQPAVELLDADEDAAHLRDRVDAEIAAASRARRARASRPPDATKPRCATASCSLGRLGHDRRVGAHARGDRLGSDARELLVGDGGQDHVAAQARAARPRPSRACRRRGSPSCRTRHGRRGGRLRAAARTDPSCRPPRPCPCARSASASDRRPTRARPRRRSAARAPARRASSRDPRARTTPRRTARSRASPEPPGDDVRVDRLDRDELRGQLGDVAHVLRRRTRRRSRGSRRGSRAPRRPRRA